MKKLVLILLWGCISLSAQTNVFPALGTNNTWTGINTFGVMRAPITKGIAARQLTDTGIITRDFSSAIQATNSSDYLHSIVPYASTGVTHPDVYYNPVGWNGWKYWLAATPYSGTDADKENPSLWVSNDGQNWQVPPGVTNPLWPSNYAVDSSYNADTELIDALDGSLYLCWIHQNIPSVGANLECLSSTDGVTWSNHFTAYNWANYSVSRPASPALLFDGTTWTMYYVEVGGPSPVAGSGSAIMKMTASSIAGPWSAPVAVSLTVPTGKVWWHLNANMIGNQTVLLIEVADGGSYGVGNSQLYLAWATDGTTFTIGTSPLLVGAAGQWDTNLYRSAMVPMLDGFFPKLAIWFVGIGTSGWQIGYTEAYLRPTLSNNSDHALNVDIKSGKTTYQDTAIRFWTCNPTCLNTYNIESKTNTGFRISNPTSSSTNKTVFELLVNGQTSLHSGGSASIALNVNAGSGTGGVIGGDGAGNTTWSVGASGKGTFNGGIGTGTNGSSNKSVCWKDTTHIGYCSTTVGADGSCTCN